MSDPVIIPDDHLAADRTRVRELGITLDQQIGRITIERAALLLTNEQLRQRMAVLEQEAGLRDAHLARVEEEARKAKVDGWCDVCAGKGDPGTGFRCVCDGTGRAAVEVINLRGLLIQWERLLADAPEGATGSNDVREYLRQLQALAEAVKALAKAENWQIEHVGDADIICSEYISDEELSRLLLAIANGLLAIGPRWDLARGRRRVMAPCKHLDHNEATYGDSCDLIQINNQFECDVKYWHRRVVPYENAPRNVQFCGQGRGRINGIFQCYNPGEMPCYEPARKEGGA